MSKVFQIAARDFIATVTTKGFLIALLLPMVFYGAAFRLFPRFMDGRGSHQQGQIAIIDPTHEVIDGFRTYLSHDAMFERRKVLADRAQSAIAPGGQLPVPMPVIDVPDFVIEELPGDASPPRETEPLRSRDASGRLALIVVHGDAVMRPNGQAAYGGYEAFVRPSIDGPLQREILDGVERAIVVARQRAEGLDPVHLATLADVDRPQVVVVSADSRSQTTPALTRALPVAFMILLMLSVMSSGQYLLTTTIEEKSSRTMEVILSAVSPMQLMAGKIIGQLGVGLLVLTFYSSVGLFALFSMAMLGLVRLSLLAYLLIFFLITYFVMGSIMAAVGSAVNDLREAQGLMMPITMTTMIPWLLWVPITRDPGSTLATVLSFVPPIGSYVMMLRLTSATPPPVWQTWLAIGVGVSAAFAAVWFASRVFRIGLLMYGRPPNLATLLRWARQA